MNVASLELCKELYELSGWEDTDKYWARPFSDGKNHKYEVIGEHERCSDSFHNHKELPAYALGYLLRKLPAYHDRLMLTLQWVQRITKHPDWDLKWVAWYIGPNGESDKWDKAEPINADTPEDAACKLLITLIKQGVIKREEDSPNE